MTRVRVWVNLEHGGVKRLEFFTQRFIKAEVFQPVGSLHIWLEGKLLAFAPGVWRSHDVDFPAVTAEE